MQVTKKNPFTGKETTLDLPVTQAQMVAWEKGMLAQRAFPQLNADQREFIISGIPPGEFERTLATKLDRKLFTEHERTWSSEASDLGFKLGDGMPELITIGDDLPVFELVGELEDDGGWEYRAIGESGEKLTIFND